MLAQRVLKSCDYRSIDGVRARFQYVRCPAQRWLHKALFVKIVCLLHALKIGLGSLLLCDLV